MPGKWGEVTGGSDEEKLKSTLRELEAVKLALDQSAIVAITDRVGRIVHVNDKFCQISKYSREELIDQNHRIINSGHHGKEFFVQMWKAISSGKTWEGEIRNRAKDGSIYWVNTTIVPFLDEKGDPRQYISIRYEITQRKLAEEQLRKYADTLEAREESIRSLFNSTFEAIFVHEKGVILDVNQTAEQIFGFPASELIGKNLGSFISADRADFAAVQGISNFEAMATCKDGSQVHLEIAGKPYEHQGRVARISSMRDVTTKKQMETQILMQDRLASVGLLASGLAHEIGTPLGVIRGRAEYLALQMQDSPEIRKNADVIVSQIDRVSRLIRSLLNLARGDQIKASREIDLKQVVDEVLELMGHEFQKHGIEVKNELGRTVALGVKGESQPLHQVLLNLFVNAVHAVESAKKSGRDSGHFIRLGVIERPLEWDLRVEDSGCGISEKNMKNLFKPFFTTKDIGVGTGLGLATSYRIMESWGGRITVESREGQGATFHLFFPKAKKGA